MSKKGVFIVFEGIDGCGKDTHIEILAKKLTAAGFQVTKTYEPWESEEAALLKKIAADGERKITPEEEADLYLQDRLKHARQVIIPALEEGRIVLCNRYYYSTMAYQGALGADPKKILEANERSVPIPDLVLMLKVGIDEGLRRIRARGKGIAKGYEKYEYLRKVSSILYNINSEKIITINTERPYQAVSDEIFIESKKVIALNTSEKI